MEPSKQAKASSKETKQSEPLSLDKKKKRELAKKLKNKPEKHKWENKDISTLTRGQLEQLEAKIYEELDRRKELEKTEEGRKELARKTESYSSTRLEHFGNSSDDESSFYNEDREAMYGDSISDGDKEKAIRLLVESKQMLEAAGFSADESSISKEES